MIGVIKVVLTFLSVGFIPARCEYKLQIVAPDRQATVKDLGTAMRKAEQEVRYRVSADIFYISNQNPNPEEVVTFFCDALFENNASVILSLNYETYTSRATNYIVDMASKLGYPVISWDPVYEGSLSVRQVLCIEYITHHYT